MTDSGNKPEWHKNNDLGGRDYTHAEQQLLMFLSAGIRSRDPLFRGVNGSLGMPPDNVRPRDYIPAYTKVAGFIYELARNLTVYPFPPQIPQKTLEEWILIVTALKVPGYEEPPPGLHHIETRLLLDGEVVASSADPDPLVESRKINIEAIDPEKAKAILLRLCDQFPELVDGEDQPVNAGDLVEELGILLRAAATE